MRRFHLSFVFCCLATLFAFSAPLLAQTPPAYPGNDTAFPASFGSADSNAGTNGSWDIEGPGVSGTPTGWNVTCTGTTKSNHTMTITVPASLPISSYGSYYASYVTGYTTSGGGYSTGYTCNFQVVAAPPTLPPAGNPAFSWQGTVAGVNTGNGNKTTTLPIVGWTQRGGMPVSIALYHNSQGPNYVAWGNKWVPSYFSYISGGASAPVLHWDNGLSYAFALNGGIYVPPAGIMDKLTYSGGVFTLTTPGNTVYTFGYVPGSAYLSSIADMDGNTLSVGHNADTTVSTVTDSTNRTLSYAYSGGHLSTVTDPLGRVWTFNYGAAGGTNSSNLWYVTLPTLNGQIYAEWFGYDSNSNITAMQTPQGSVNNQTSTFGYDTSSPPRFAWAKDPLGNQTTFAYNSNNTVITDPNGHTTTHTYSYSQLSSVTDALGYISYSEYDFNNILNGVIDKRGNLWRYSSHFSNGTSTSTSTDPLGYSSSSTYDGKNKVTNTADALGNTTASTYSTDSKEDLLTTSVTGTGSSPFKATSKVGGYTNGLPTTFTDPLGFSSSVGYDANGYANSATDANNNKSAAVFNALGWKMSSTDANGNKTSYTYDNWGRVTIVTAPDNTQTTMTYDANGNVLTATDANNHTVTNIYDGDNRLTQTTNGRGDVVQYTYDGPSGYGSADRNGQTQLGLLSSKTDGNNHTTYYSYTARNEPAVTYYPDGTGESVWYDENGNTVKRQKPDYSYISYAYDKDNRLTDITYPTLHATHFDYDADGRKTHMSDATGDTYWYFTYDGLHENQQTTPQGTVYFTYDGDGRRYQRSINTPAAGQSAPWTYAYDNGGRLTSLQTPFSETTTLSYDSASRLTRQINGDGTYSNFAYDDANQETDIWYYTSANALLGHLVYGHDQAGNIQSLTQNGNVVTTYGYDGADQLTSEVHSGDGAAYSLGFTYDHNGNRLTQTSGGTQIQAFTYNAHDVLAGTGGESETYDRNGNLKTQIVGGQQTSYVWDDEDRLTSVTTASGTSTFVYNGLGLRVGKTDSTGTYRYLCDGTSPGADVLSDGAAVYTAGLSDHRGNASTFSHDDLLGSLRFLTTGQNVTMNLLPDAFGETVSQAGSLLTPFAWNGGSGYQSDAGGLKLLGHRYYDPRIGRFISQDPAGDGDNWYAYADNNPVNETDPTGLFTPPYHNHGVDSSDGTGQMSFGDPGGMAALDQAFLENGSQIDNYHRTVTREVGVGINRVVGDTGWVYDGSTPLFGGGMIAAHPMDEMEKAFNDLTKAIIDVGKGDTNRAALDGAKAYNKSLKAATGTFIVAGKSTKADIRDLKRLEKSYGRTAKNWRKMGGFMPGLDGGLKVEIHWYQYLEELYVEAKCKL